MANEKKDRILVAQGKSVVIIPLADMQLPDEPILRVQASTHSLTVGTKHLIRLDPLDRRLSLEIDDLPDGAVRTDAGIEWTPTEEQVGTEKISMQLSHGEVERQQVERFDVSFPSIKLPFKANQLAVSPDGESAVVWNRVDPRGLSRNNREMVMKEENRVAIIDLANGKLLVEKVMPFKIASVAVDNMRIYVGSAESTYCQVFEKSTLKKLKTLYVPDQVGNVSIDGSRLLVGANMFDRKTLKPIVDSASSNSSQILDLVWPIDQIATGALDNKRQPNARNNRVRQQNPGQVRSMNIGGRGVESNQVKLENVAAFVSAWTMTQQRQVPGATHTTEYAHELGLNVVSSVNKGLAKRVKLVSETLVATNNNSRSVVTPRIESNGDAVVVLSSDRLFQWSADSMDKSDLPEEFRIEPVVPQLIQAGGTTTISPDVSGGKQPLGFVLLKAVPGIEVDEKKGVVTIDNTSLVKQCETAFVKSLNSIGMERRGSLLAKVTVYNSKTKKLIERELGKEMEGVPVSFALRLRGTDDEAQRAEVNIPLLVEIDADVCVQTAQKVERVYQAYLAELEAKREKRRAEMTAQRDAARQGDQHASTNDELVKLRKKVETLEARIDLMTRQLSEVLEILKKRN